MAVLFNVMLFSSWPVQGRRKTRTVESKGGAGGLHESKKRGPKAKDGKYHCQENRSEWQAFHKLLYSIFAVSICCHDR